MNLSENEPIQGGKFFTSGTQYSTIEIPKIASPTPKKQTKSLKIQHLTDWFVSVSLLHMLIIIGLTVFRLVRIQQENPGSPEFTFNIVLLNNAVFCVCYVIYGVLRKKAYELYTFILACFIFLIFGIVDYTLLNIEGRTIDKLVMIVANCVLAIPNTYLALSVARGFKVDRHTYHLESTYKRKESFSALLKFDLQVTSSLILLTLKGETSLDLQEQSTLGLGLTYTFLWCVLGWFTLKREIKCLAWLFFIYGLAKPIYYLFRIVKIYIHLSENKDVDSLTLYPTLVFGAACLLVWLILTLELPVVYKSFNRKDTDSQRISTEHSSLLRDDQS